MEKSNLLESPLLIYHLYQTLGMRKLAWGNDIVIFIGKFQLSSSFTYFES